MCQLGNLLFKGFFSFSKPVLTFSDCNEDVFVKNLNDAQYPCLLEVPNKVYNIVFICPLKILGEKVVWCRMSGFSYLKSHKNVNKRAYVNAYVNEEFLVTTLACRRSMSVLTIVVSIHSMKNTLLYNVCQRNLKDLGQLNRKAEGEVCSANALVF